MPNLETIVRPFQTRDVTPARRVAANDANEAVENLVLQFGKSGAGVSYNISYSHSFEKYMTKRQKELIEDE